MDLTASGAGQRLSDDVAKKLAVLDADSREGRKQVAVEAEVLDVDGGRGAHDKGDLAGADAVEECLESAHVDGTGAHQQDGDLVDGRGVGDVEGEGRRGVDVGHVDGEDLRGVAVAREGDGASGHPGSHAAGRAQGRGHVFQLSLSRTKVDAGVVKHAALNELAVGEARKRDELGRILGVERAALEAAGEAHRGVRAADDQGGGRGVARAQAGADTKVGGAEVTVDSHAALGVAVDEVEGVVAGATSEQEHVVARRGRAEERSRARLGRGPRGAQADDDQAQCHLCLHDGWVSTGWLMLGRLLVGWLVCLSCC